MSRPLTSRQQQYLIWITDFYFEHGKSPTMQQLAERFDVRPPSAFDVVNALVKKGYLQKVGRGPYRSLELLDEFGEPRHPHRLPLVGQVAAGRPILAVENRIGSISVDDRLLRRGATFALKVRGDSMVEVGIMDGDFVIIRPQPTADNGDIVLALIGDEATIKRYYLQENGMVRLHPENRTMEEIIVPAGECLIQGKVIALQREL